MCTWGGTAEALGAGGCWWEGWALPGRGTRSGGMRSQLWAPPREGAQEEHASASASPGFASAKPWPWQIGSWGEVITLFFQTPL